MTAYALQKDLAEEVEEILKDILLKDVNGKSAKMKAFPQALPKRFQEVSDEKVNEGVMEEDDPEEDPYPYCVIRVESGNMDMVQGAQQIETMLVFGIFDDDKSHQGHQVIMNMIHKIASRFTANSVLKGRYRVNEQAGISWILDDEDRYPYYFGAMNMAWDTFFVGREEDRYV